MNCYLCPVEINEINKTKEHIIPNSIGGRLKSERIICVNCNSKYGHTLDLVFEKIPLTTLLDIKKERGNTQKVEGITQSGQKILIDSNLNPEIEKLLVTYEDGNRVFTIRNEKEARLILKEHKIQNIDEALKKIEWTCETIQEPVILTNDILSGKEFFRAIARIAVSYYYHLSSNLSGLANIISFIKDEIDLFSVYYYFPSNIVYQTDAKEISHLLYIRGNSKEKILYSYIELFNCYCFIVLLSDNYNGVEFENKYIYDLESRTVLTKPFSLELSRNDILSLPIPISSNGNELFMQRIKSMLSKKGIEYHYWKTE